jgi:integrase
MALGKQSKTLSKAQTDAVTSYLGTRRHGLRDQTIFLLSIKAGLRAKEIAHLKWSMVLGSDGNIGDAIHLTDVASKGKGGRIIPLNKQLRSSLIQLFEQERKRFRFSCEMSYVITTERSDRTSAQAVVNMFAQWYADLGLIGC